jgi:dihydroorotate dehydrogenase electron transfer subunit
MMNAPARIIENVALAPSVYRVRFEAPGLAATIRPGQFLMMRIMETTDPLLGRPFALYDTVRDSRGRPMGIDVVYLVMGKFTRRLAVHGRDEQVEIWGPLGNGFPDLSGIKHVALVAGGIGQTPFLAYARKLLGERGYGGQAAQRQVEKVSLYYGVRTAELAAGIEDFRAAGVTVHLASDDGTIGFRGVVTQLLDQHEPPDHLIGCGPEPMLKALAQHALRRKVPCHLSLESPMACGIGICFSCVAPLRTSAGWDYRRICLDGPVFDATDLAWAEASRTG